MSPEMDPLSAVGQAVYRIKTEEYQVRNPVQRRTPDTPFNLGRALVRAACIVNPDIVVLGEDELSIVVDSSKMKAGDWSTLQSAVEDTTVGIIAKSLSNAYLLGSMREELCWLLEMALDHRNDSRLEQFAVSAAARVCLDMGVPDEGISRPLTYEGYLAALVGLLTEMKNDGDDVKND